MITNRLVSIRAIYIAFALVVIGIIPVNSSSKSAECNHVFSSDSGWITSPNYPENYPVKSKCSWLINATQSIVFSFTRFQMQYFYDWLTIYDGPDTLSSILFKESSNDTIPSEIVTTSNQVLVTFIAQGSRNHPGFNLTYSPYRCKNVLSSESGWFASPNYPEKYHKISNTCWSIKTSQKNIISFSVFQIDKHGDWLRIYDGPTTSSVLLLETSTRPISSIVTTADEILITFTTFGVSAFAGFNATYSSYRCLEVLSSQSGWFASPNHPLNYSDNINCNWLINTIEPLLFSFPRIDSTETDKNWLTIYNGPTETSTVLLKASSNDTIPVISTSNQVLISFTSDGSNSFSKFNATYAPYSCNNVLSSESGWFASPNYPNNYPDSSINCWLIKSKTPKSFSFVRFETEKDRDWLTIYDGPSPPFPQILKASSIKTIPSSLNTTSSEILIIFISDGSNSYPGFNISYSSLGCNYVLSSDSGWFSSPNFPEKYSDNAECSWLIQATQPITLSFPRFHLEPQSDWLTVFDGPTTSSAILVKESVNKSLPWSVMTSSNHVLVTFTSDEYVSYSGFNLTYSPSECQNVPASDLGWISSPNHPDNYPNSYKSCWIINAELPLVFLIPAFDLGIRDWLRVYDGPTTSVALVGASTSKRFLPPSIVSTESKVLAVFTSDEDVSHPGFNLTYSATRCQYISSTDSGWFTSPNHPENYPRLSNLCWIINTTQPIILLFTRFHLSPNTHWIKIYDGPTLSFDLLLKATWNYTIPSSIVTTASQVLVTLHSDKFSSFSGFNLTYSPFYPEITSRPVECNETIHLNSSEFVLTSLNYPLSYPNIRCNWLFISDPETSIEISFTEFSTQPEDYVVVTDGLARSDSHRRLMYSSGMNASNPLSCNFVSSSNKLHVSFHPYSNQPRPSNAGFRATLKINKCGGQFSNSTAEILKFQTNVQNFISSNCIWNIQVSEGSKVNFTLNNIIQSTSNIDSYSLEVFEGHLQSSGDNYLAKVTNISSFKQPIFVVSESNEITVILNDNQKSNSACRSRKYPKLNLTYEATTSSTVGCYGKMNPDTSELSLLSSLSNQLVPSSLRCKWKVGNLLITSRGDTIIEKTEEITDDYEPWENLRMICSGLNQGSYYYHVSL